MNKIKINDKVDNIGNLYHASIMKKGLSNPQENELIVLTGKEVHAVLLRVGWGLVDRT